MKRAFVMAGVTAMVLSGTAWAVDGSLPGGTSITVDITSPVEGAIVEVEGLVVTGTASVGVGVAPVPDTTIVYVLDVSGSTSESAGVGCDNVAGNDSILACEKAAVQAVNAEAALPNSPVSDSGVVSFNSSATAYDFDSGVGVDLLAPPGASIDAAVASLTAGGGTSFVAGLTAANTALAQSTSAHKVVVFLSDGENTAGGSLPNVPSGTIVRAFAIGGSTCGAGSPSLNQVAAKGAAGSMCQQVSDLSVLDDVVGDAVGSSLDSVTISVDGAPPVDVSPASLPAAGPVTVSFTADLSDLEPGGHMICVTANGIDAGGSGSVGDCVDITVSEVVVACTGTCQATIDDGGISTGQFTGVGLTKQVGLSAADTGATECGGNGCVTGYDVSFVGGTGNGIAEFTVVVPPPNATPVRQAEIYLDGVEVTDRCLIAPIPTWLPPRLLDAFLRAAQNNLPCQRITRAPGGGTKYYVRFGADPGIRFR